MVVYVHVSSFILFVVVDRVFVSSGLGRRRLETLSGLLERMP